MEVSDSEQWIAWKMRRSQLLFLCIHAEEVPLDSSGGWWKSKHKTVPVFDKVKYQTPELRSDSAAEHLDVGTHNFVCCKFSPRKKEMISGFKLSMDFNCLVICQEIVVTNMWLHCTNYFCKVNWYFYRNVNEILKLHLNRIGAADSSNPLWKAWA